MRLSGVPKSGLHGCPHHFLKNRNSTVSASRVLSGTETAEML
jgi:hypothetical protein